MTEAVQDTKLPYAERIAKLLRKAESTDSEHEAEALVAKAQELMTRYSIDAALLAQAQGLQVQETVVKHSIVYSGIFHMALFDIGNAIAKAQGCRTLIIKMPKTNTKLEIIGWESDVTNAKMLDASLQLQASTAMQRWYRAQRTDGLTPMQKAKMRRQFLQSFAQGLAAKLAVAKRAGTEAAAADEAERSGVDLDTATKSTDLVIRDRAQQVDDWVDREYGSTLRTVRRNYSFGGYGAASAGYEAGRNADVGQPRVGGRRAIEQ